MTAMAIDLTPHTFKSAKARLKSGLSLLPLDLEHDVN